MTEPDFDGDSMPAEPTTPHRGNDGRRRRRLAIVIAVVLLLDVAALLVIHWLPARPTNGDIVVAEAFLADLVAGNLPSETDPETIGWTAAFERLTDRKQDELGFAAFVALFSDDVESWGALESYKKMPREEGGMNRRTLEYRLGFTGSSGQRRSRALRLVMVPVKNSHRIDDLRLGEEVR